MNRELLENLIHWRNQSEYLPLLLRGARQVGKTFLIQEFAKSHFKNCVSINLELEPEFNPCFETLKPLDIVNKIELLSKQTITPGETLLFLDEIQNCPNAIMALRYFKEQLPTLHVIGAGSLLEFALREKNFKMPVGRIQYLYLKPLSFREYLKATQNDQLLEFLSSLTLNSIIPAAIHEHALKLVREYINVGGMPMVVNDFIRNQKLQQVQNEQTLLLRTYSDDFAKYAKSTQHKYLQQVYQRVPGLVGQQIKYSHIAANMNSHALKEAILDLKKAGVISQIFSSSASGLPLNTYINEKKFKLLFLDVGLLKRATKIDIELLFNEDLILLNRGTITEQFVGQELLAYQNPYDEAELFYWFREAKNSSAEVDYVTHIGSNIVPIEVKSGKTGSLKSLHLLLKENHLPFGVRISAKEFTRHNNIISIPFYLIHRLAQLIQTS